MTIKREIKNKRNSIFLKTLLVIVRKVICTLSYRKDELVKNSTVSYEFINDIRLTLKFRNIYSMYLNNSSNEGQRKILMSTITMI